jgi:hypothetical protein
VAARLVPGIADDVEAIRDLTRASVLGAQAGMVRAGCHHGRWDGETSRRGAGRLTRPSGRGPGAELAADLLGAPRRYSTPLEADGDRFLEDAIADAKDEVRERRQAERASLAAELLPFPRLEGARTYALVMMTLGSAAWRVPRLVRGVSMTAAVDLQRSADRRLGTRPVAAPDEVEALRPLRRVDHFIASTYSPDWPTSARI